MRWRHPQRGLLLPSAFATVAEETGMIVAIGRFVLEQACRQAASWRERFTPPAPLAIAVNLSAAQLEDDHVVADVSAALARAALEPSALIVEIGESLLMDDTSEACLRSLDELGVQIALDDFGTGYSSLEYLRRFPIDILKMARPFVDGPLSSAEAALAQAIVDLGENLELTVIAEGVDRPRQAQILRDLGCRYAQGFYFAPPMDADMLGRLLSRSTIQGWPAASGSPAQGQPTPDRQPPSA
jgi:EAL domain-containing protein (putative c-di-GMP-specific phosphodiesterase class I)